MTDARTEWISKRAYALWEAAGRKHGHDGEHWEQAVREREEFERVALGTETAPVKSTKPLIEIAGTAQAKAAPATKGAKARAKPKAAKGTIESKRA
jgi:hypothetical protein